MFILFNLKGRGRLNMTEANICILLSGVSGDILQEKECIVLDDLHLDCDPSP